MDIVDRGNRTELRRGGNCIALVCEVQIDGVWWWVAMKPNREFLSAEGRGSRREALQDALQCVKADGRVVPLPREQG